MATITATKHHHSGTSVHPWYAWNDTTPTSGTLTIDPWRTWTTTSTTTHLTYNQNYTWNQWVEMPEEYQTYHRYPLHQPTQAELDAAQRRREEASARALANRQRMIGAEDRALELFRSLLTADQIQTMDADGEVWVKGSAGGLYVIETRGGRVHGNIRRVDAHGCLLGRLCVQPSMYDYEEGAALPSSDGHVGQLLAIRFNEPALLEKANWSGRRGCTQPDLPILRAA